ncbi:MAG: hypothetical protein ACRDDY_16275 [Clostridium sp.]
MKILIFLLISVPFFIALFILYSYLKKMINNKNTALKKRNEFKESKKL